MIIQTLDRKRMLINLDENDLQIFNIKTSAFSFRDEPTKLIIREILSLAVIKTGLNTKNRTLSVEALPYRQGCYILVTLKNKSDRKKFRIKQVESTVLIRFFTAEALLDAISILYPKNMQAVNTDLYLYNGARYLLLRSNKRIPDSIILTLSEYGKCYPCSKLMSALLAEKSQLIRQNDAITYIGEILDRH